MTGRRRRRTALRPWIERVWAGEGSRLASWALRLLSFPYALASGAARSRARRSRRRFDGVRVIAIGGLTVGGAGKTTLARWAAREALRAGARPAVLLRGYGSKAAARPAEVVSPEAATALDGPRRFGDEAVAHRKALPAEVEIVVGANRWEGAALARTRGATVVLLDDGWEQGSLAWDSLWVAVDALEPFGNGRTLPAGPLRRPPANLREANAIAVIAENPREASAAIPTAIREAAGATPIPVVRFARAVESWAPLDAAGAGGAPNGSVLLVSSVGAPGKLQRFLEGAGLDVAEHLAFPDHGDWDRDLVTRRAASLRAKGAAALVVTDKDARRAADLGDLALPIWVLRSGLMPVDDPSPLLDALRDAAGAPGPPMAGSAPIR